MFKHYTKSFTGPDPAGKIDAWLKTFEKDVPACEGNCAEIIGYVVLDKEIVITIRRWETYKPAGAITMQDLGM